MTGKPTHSDDSPDEMSLFQEVVSGITPLSQDKVVHKRKPVSTAIRRSTRNTKAQRQIDASFVFSDIYQASLPVQGPIRWSREGEPTHSIKRLRRGDFYPELVLDLHGLNKEATKLELSALIHTARKELIDCVSIIHGIGSGILKNALPHYLVQHPHVKAFHQAPLEYGGQGALVVLIETLEMTEPNS